MREAAAGRDTLARRVFGALAVLTALASPAAAATPASAAAPGVPTAAHVSILPTHVWTDTRVALQSGDNVTIRTTGRIHFGAPPIDRLTPPGIPRGPQCDAVAARRSAAPTAWPAPSLSCWSLIGRIGEGAPFEIGAAHTIHAAKSGELFLGVNDNFLGDNAGQWSTTVIVVGAAPAPVSTGGGGAKHSSSLPLLLAIAGLVVAAALAYVALTRRQTRNRRKRGGRARTRPRPAPRAPAPTPTPDEAVAIPAVVEPVVAEPVAPVAPPAPVAPVVTVTAGDDQEFTDVNIFEVEFPDVMSLRVGYNHFPEGTIVSWRVTQHERFVGSGEFVAEGGGARYHFVTVPLATSVATGADVNFSWNIGGVPFGYSVRREPVG